MHNTDLESSPKQLPPSLEGLESSLKASDPLYEINLRPTGFNEFLGQDQVLKRLNISMSAAKSRNEAMGHCLLSGPPGLGKTTLANLLATGMNGQLVVTTGPNLEKAKDLAGLLTRLNPGDFLFIDEIHRLPKCVEEYLYPALEDFVLDLVIDSGPHAKLFQIKLNRFTLVGATTQAGQISAPLRSRFLLHERLEYYNPNILAQIILSSSNKLQLKLTGDAANMIAKRSRGTPRIANNLLRWVRDYATFYQKDAVDEQVALEALSLLSINPIGLDETDIKLLQVMIHSYSGGPVGLSTLAVAIGENPRTIEEVHEPFLILSGLIKRTPRGREVTPLAYQQLGLTSPDPTSDT
jgi:Holliday junction DNA helicase RuvB